MTDYKRKKKRKRRFLYADQGISVLIFNEMEYVIPVMQERRFNIVLKRRSCMQKCPGLHTRNGVSSFSSVCNQSISLNINTMQHTHALTSTPNTDHPVLMRLPI